MEQSAILTISCIAQLVVVSASLTEDIDSGDLVVSLVVANQLEFLTAGKDK